MNPFRRIPFDVPGVTLELDEGIAELDWFATLYVTPLREALTEQVVGRCIQIARDLDADICIPKSPGPSRTERARADRAACVKPDGSVSVDMGERLSDRELRELGHNKNGVYDFPVAVADGVLLCPRSGSNVKQTVAQINHQKDTEGLTTETVVADCQRRRQIVPDSGVKCTSRIKRKGPRSPGWLSCHAL
jgi:hypothetical protein